MMTTVSTDLLLRLFRASPEQLADVERILGGPGGGAAGRGESGKRRNGDTAKGDESRGDTSPYPLPDRGGEGGGAAGGEGETANRREGETARGDESRGDTSPYPLPDRGGEGDGDRRQPRCVFRRVGRRYWGVVFAGGDEFILEDTLGARYLNYLLHHPNEAIAAYDLEAAITPEKANAQPLTSSQAALDPKAARAALVELERLRTEMEQANDAGDWGRGEELAERIEAAESALRTPRLAADSGERARGNVRKAITAVLRNLRNGEEQEKAFARHVGNCLSMGYELFYADESGGLWG